MATAAERVLELPELLERILLLVPMRDLLLSQRVSKFWQALIANSLSLQQALFFKPAKNFEPFIALLVDEHRDKDSAQGPCLVGGVADIDVECYEEGIEWTSVAEANPLLPWDNPWFQASTDGQSRSEVVRSIRQAFEADESLLLWNDFPMKNETGVEPSWKRMYLCQPPETVVFVPQQDEEDDRGWHILRVEADEGVRLGQVANAIRSVIHIESSSELRWLSGPSIHVVVYRYSEVLEEGIRLFKKLESRLGRKKALEIGFVHPQEDLYLLLQGRNIDRLIEVGMMDAVLNGMSVGMALVDSEYYRIRKAEGRSD